MTEKVQHRTKTFDNVQHAFGSGTNPSYPPYNFVTSRSTSNYEWDDTAIGGDLPQYRAVIRQGGNAANPYQASRSTFSGSPQNSVWTEHVHYIVNNPPFDPVVINYVNGERWRAWVLVGGPDSSTFPSTAEAINQSYMSFLKKATAIQQAFSSGVFLGELRETLHMIRHPAQVLRSGLSDYLGFLKKRRHRISPKARPKFLRDTWLEYSFGWAPLVNDIRDARRALERSAFSREITQRVIGFGAKDVELAASSLGGPHSVMYTSSQTSKVKAWTYGAVRTSPDSSVRQLRNVGISLTDFLPTIWELIPWSFLVDYFTNIGEVVQAYSFRYSDIAWAARSVKSEIESSTKPAGVTQPLPQYVTVSPGHGSCKWLTERFTRDVLQAHDIMPSLAFEVPGMSSLKWINLAALSRQHRSLVPY